MKNYLFIVRAYNDIDHFTPIIDKVLELNKAKVFFYSSTPIEFHKKNEDIIFLKKKYNLNLNYIFINKQKNIFYLEKIYVFLRNFFKNKNLPNILSTINNKFLKMIQKKLNNYYLKNDDWVIKLFEDTAPNIIFYDWTAPNKFPYSKISLFAKNSKIPIIALPHGHSALINDNTISDTYYERRKKNIKRILANTIDDIYFDKYVVPDHFTKKRLMGEAEKLESVKNNDDIIVLGSPRFEKNWIEKKMLFQNKFEFSNNKYDIKIVIFPTKLMYKGDANSIRQILNKCSELTENLVLKPHTRGMNIDFLSDIIKKNNVNVVYDSYNSSQLIEWSDLSIVWGSSIGFHALSINKPIIVPIFAQYDQKTVYEKFSRVIVANNIRELEYKVSNFKDFILEFNSDEGIKEIIRNSVYNFKESSVSEYIRFFEETLK